MRNLSHPNMDRFGRSCSGVSGTSVPLLPELRQLAAEGDGAVQPRSMPYRPPFGALAARERLPKPTVIL